MEPTSETALRPELEQSSHKMAINSSSLLVVFKISI